MKWLALAIILAAMIVAGAILVAAPGAAECDDNPFTERPACR